MNKILLPIKPEYANKIFSEDKKFEYRKKTFKNENIDTIVVYVTSPVKKIIGEFELIDTLISTPEEIWEQTWLNGGISKKNYDEYFKSRNIAYAYKIGRVTIYEKPKKLIDFSIDYFPQSFVYL